MQFKKVNRLIKWFKGTFYIFIRNRKRPWKKHMGEISIIGTKKLRKSVCPICGKRQYVPELMSKFFELYGNNHVGLFRCLHCNSQITMEFYVSINLFGVKPQTPKNIKEMIV